MTFTYVDKPDPQDILAASQADIQGNFEYLQWVINQDHLLPGFNQPSNIAPGNAYGHHSKATMEETGTAAPAIPAGPTALRGVLNNYQGNLYWRAIGMGAGNSQQLTNNSVIPTVTTNVQPDPVGTLTQGYTFLPGGLMMAYGNINRSGVVMGNLQQLGTVTYGNGGFSFNGVPENAISISVGLQYAGANNVPTVYVSNGMGTQPSATQFTWILSSSTTSTINGVAVIYWSAIGRKS